MGIFSVVRKFSVSLSLMCSIMIFDANFLVLLDLFDVGFDSYWHLL